MRLPDTRPDTTTPYGYAPPTSPTSKWNASVPP